MKPKWSWITGFLALGAIALADPSGKQSLVSFFFSKEVIESVVTLTLKQGFLFSDWNPSALFVYSAHETLVKRALVPDGYVGFRRIVDVMHENALNNVTFINSFFGASSVRLCEAYKEGLSFRNTRLKEKGRAKEIASFQTEVSALEKIVKEAGVFYRSLSPEKLNMYKEFIGNDQSQLGLTPDETTFLTQVFDDAAIRTEIDSTWPKSLCIGGKYNEAADERDKCQSGRVGYFTPQEAIYYLVTELAKKGLTLDKSKFSDLNGAQMRFLEVLYKREFRAHQIARQFVPGFREFNFVESRSLNDLMPSDANGVNSPVKGPKGFVLRRCLQAAEEQMSCKPIVDAYISGLNKVIALAKNNCQSVKVPQ